MSLKVDYVKSGNVHLLTTQNATLCFRLMPGEVLNETVVRGLSNLLPFIVEAPGLSHEERIARYPYLAAL